MDPPKAGELIIRFHDALAAGLVKGGMKVMEPATVRARLKLGVENAGCFEGGCIRTAQGLLKTKKVVAANIKSVGKNYTIEVRLYSGDKVYSKSTGRCDICTFAEAIAATTKVATEVGSKGETPPPVVPKPVVPKPVKPVQPKPVQAQPKPDEPARPPVTEKPIPVQVKKPWPLWPGIVLAGVGVVGLAAGIPLIAIDGDGTNCTGEPLPNYAHCADLYSTGAGGWVLTGIGVAALAASGVMFYLHFSSKPKEAPTGIQSFMISPTTEGGVVIGASGEF